MKQILWFRRDLRLTDNAILANAKGRVLPIFIFDKNILDNLPQDDKRVTFIYKSVLDLKANLKNIGLDLAIFYGYPNEIFKSLKSQNFDEVLCSVDFDSYAIKRDKEIEQIIKLQRYQDSFILNPEEHLKKDGTAYKVFTPFYNSLEFLHKSLAIEIQKPNQALQKCEFEYEKIPTLEDLGFKKQTLPSFLNANSHEILKLFLENIKDYENDRDFFHLDATSKMSVFLRFGLISPKEIFNEARKVTGSDFFIRELFWREFYNYILFHFPKSEFENFNGKTVKWRNNSTDFQAWCEGKTGVPIIDASMRYLNATGLMHNRLRMVVSSFLCKNLLIDWRLGERYFAQKLLDCEASSNIGSWQWSASTGADAVPYFRVFNPYTQSEKFDKEALFIKSVLKELKEVEPKQIHKENALDIKPIVSIKSSRLRAIEAFKEA